LGQTVNSITTASNDFADLLPRGGERGRDPARCVSTSPYPTGLHATPSSPAMAETPAVCEHVHLPVQSGSSRTL